MRILRTKEEGEVEKYDVNFDMFGNLDWRIFTLVFERIYGEIFVLEALKFHRKLCLAIQHKFNDIVMQ